MTTFEGFVEAGGETRTTNWSCSNTESTFKDPPPRSPHASPPSPPFEEVNISTLPSPYTSANDLTRH